MIELRKGWASFSYKPDGKGGVLYTPDSIHATESEAEWGFVGTGRIGWPHEVLFVEVDGKAHIVSENPIPLVFSRGGDG